MAAAAPKRLVRCPKCRNVLEEAVDVPIYQCAVCNTMLRAKYWKPRGDDGASTESGKDFSQKNLQDHNLEKGSSIMGAHCSADAGDTSRSGDGHRKTGEELQNGGKGNGIGDDSIKLVGEKLENDLIHGNKTKEFVKSSDQESVLEENAADGDLGNGASSNVVSPTNTSSPAYEGSVSSFDDLGGDLPRGKHQFLSKRTFRAQKFTELKKNDQGVERGGDSQKKLQETTLVSNPLNIGHHSHVMGSSTLESVNLTSRYENFTDGRGTSDLPEEFHSLENLVELEKDESFKTQRTARHHRPSSKLTDIDHSRIELLRVVDELRFQLMGSLGQRGEVDEISCSVGRRQVGRLPPMPLFGIDETKEDLLPRPHATLRSKKHLVQRIHPSRQANPYCLRCHAPPPPGIFHSSGLCMSCCHLYCHSSNSAGFPSHIVSDPPMSYHSKVSQDYKDVKQHFKVKDQAVKRHCRPISGGANFIVCYKCMELLQMPDDLHLSTTRSNKLKCGACSSVLFFTFRDGNGIAPHSCWSELLGSSSNGSRTMVRDHMLHVPRNSIESLEERDGRQQPPLHQLMGYFSASELIYQPSDGDETYSRASADHHV